MCIYIIFCYILCYVYYICYILLYYVIYIIIYLYIIYIYILYIHTHWHPSPYFSRMLAPIVAGTLWFATGKCYPRTRWYQHKPLKCCRFFAWKQGKAPQAEIYRSFRCGKIQRWWLLIQYHLELEELPWRPNQSVSHLIGQSFILRMFQGWVETYWDRIISESFLTLQIPPVQQHRYQKATMCR